MQYGRGRCGDGVEIYSFPTRAVPWTEQPGYVLSPAARQQHRPGHIPGHIAARPARKRWWIRRPNAAFGFALIWR